MIGEEVFMNVLLVFLCYAYVLLVIVVSSRMDKILPYIAEGFSQVFTSDNWKSSSIVNIKFDVFS